MACPPGMSLEDCAALYRKIAQEKAEAEAVKGLVALGTPQQGGAVCTGWCPKRFGGLVKPHVYENGKCKYCGCIQPTSGGRRRRRTNRRRNSRKVTRKYRNRK